MDAYICVFLNMVKKYRNRGKRIIRSSSPEAVGEGVFALLEAMGGSPERARLAGLWRDWAEVMGEEFAWTIPLGHQGGILFLGVEDAMEIQELGLQSALILERANAYMEREYFSRLRISIRFSGR